MLSKWYELKPKAIELRKRGLSIGDIERKIKIPRSTLSGWFKSIPLSLEQKEALRKKSNMALVKSRALAIKWHHKQKEIRLLKADTEANSVLSGIDLRNREILELALAMIYLGEGSKKNLTSIGNTDPQILKFFMKSMQIIFNIKTSEFKCDIHIRSDQNGNNLIRYWSKTLGIPTNKFISIRDNRPVKTKTYPTYKGVCVVRCGKIAIQRRIICVARKYCQSIADMDD